MLSLKPKSFGGSPSAKVGRSQYVCGMVTGSRDIQHVGCVHSADSRNCQWHPATLNGTNVSCFTHMQDPRHLGAVHRMYIEQYSDDTSKHGLDAQEALGPIIKTALEVSKLQEFTGREKPTVIT